MSEWVSNAISSSLLEDWWQQHVWSNLKYLVQCLVRCLVQSKMSTHRNCSYRPILSPRTCAKYDGQLSGRARLHLRGVFREHCSPKHATSTPLAVLADNNIKHTVLQSQKNRDCITVQNPGKWLTWNICTGGMGYARDAGMYWVLSINMNYLHWGVWGIKQIQSTWNICTDGMGSTGYVLNIKY